MKIDFFRHLAFADTMLSHSAHRLYAVVFLGIIFAVVSPLGWSWFPPIIWVIQLAVMLALAYVVYSFVRDVRQALARAEAALETLTQERNLMRTVIDHLPDNIYAKDRDGKFILNNAESLRILGAARQEDVLGKHDSDFFPKKLADEWYIEHQHLMQSGKPELDVETFQRWNSGKRRWVASSAIPLRDASRQVIGLVGVNRDITARKEAEIALRESEQSTRHFQEQLRLLHQVGIKLALTDSVDEFCRMAVELIRDQFGFDRAGVWIYDFEAQMSVGTFGTDRNGQTVDERQYRFPIDAFPFDDSVLSGQQQSVLHENIPLRELTGELLAVGWLAQVAMWDGSRVVGFLSVDNALNHRPIQPYQIELLSLYGTQLGHLYIRKQSDNALRESQDHHRQQLQTERGLLRALIDHLPDLVFIKDTAGRFLVSNRTHMRFLGGTHEQEILGKTVADFVPLEFAAQYALDDQKVFQSGEALLNKEEPITNAQGQSRWLITTKLPLYDHTGQMTGLIGISRDITQYKEAERALRESEERYRILAHLASDYAYSYRVNPDKTYELEWITEEPFYNMTGVSIDEIRNSISLYHPDDLLQMQQDMRVLLDGQPNDRDYRIFTKSGEMKWVNMMRYPVWDNSEGRVVRFYGVGKEITERKQAEDAIRMLNAELENRVEQRTAQLMMVNRELEAFAYSVSHDLRAPLRSIDGFSRMVLELYGEKLDATGQDYLHRIRAATQRTGDMIDAMLALSRVTRSELRLKTVDLSAMAHNVLAALADSDPTRSVRTTITPGLTAEGDSRLLQVMLENLLGNAWKYTSKNPQAMIEFGCETHNYEQAFYVRDNGAGFDMAYVDKLFGVFRRLHSDREFPGTGVGLATVQRIVHRHGGTIWAASEQDKGSTFYFTLHASEQQDEHQP